MLLDRTGTLVSIGCVRNNISGRIARLPMNGSMHHHGKVAACRTETKAAPASDGYSATPSFDFIPALDGLRAVSILLVVLSHLGLGRYVPGLLGVTIFFFISGFLITRQLLAELARDDRIALARFYARRLLRLYPAFLIAILAGGILLTVLGGSLTPGDTLSAIFYLSNYRELAGGFQSNLTGIPHPFGIYWSLAVEEHYYLVFPLLLLALGRNRLRFSLIVALGIVAVTVWRGHVALHCGLPAAHCLAEGDERRILHATDTRIDSILFGALLATLLGTPLAPRLLDVLRSSGSLAAGLFLIVLSIGIRDPWFRDTLRFSAQGIGLFLGVGNILFSNRWSLPRRLLSLPPTRALGRWSYSLYLWHWLVLMVGLGLLPANLREAAHQGGLPFSGWLAFSLPVLALSLAASAASYHLVERPILRLRRRYGSHLVRSTGHPITLSSG